MNESAPAAPTPEMAKANRSALFIVFLVVFIDLLGFGIVLPMLPIIADTYVAEVLQLPKNDGKVRDHPTAGLIVGLLMASFSLMQFLFAPTWGRISDRIGRRPILLLGLAGSVLFYALFGIAASIPAASNAMLALVLFFLARIGAGVAGATIATAQAVIADCTPPEKRKHGMALIGAAFGIGFTFGPLIGYLALSWFEDYPGAIGYAASALSLVALLLGLRMLPETRQFGAEPPIQRKVFDFAAWKLVFSSPALFYPILAFFLATFGFAGFEVTLAMFLKEVARIPDDSIFLYFAYVGFVLMLTQGFFYRRAAKKMSETALMTVGILFMGMGVWILGLVTWEVMGQEGAKQVTMWLVYLGLTFAVVGFAFLTPSAQALVSRRADSERQGEIMGVNQSASSLARILAPPIFLMMYKATPDHLAPYVVGGAIVLLMLPLMPKVKRG